MLAGVLAWLALDAVSVAPNRIVAGTPHRAHEVHGWWAALLASLPMLAVMGLAWRPDTRRLQAALVVVVGLLVMMPLWLATAVAALADPDMPQARLGIGASLWLLLFLWLLVLIELRTRLGLSRVFGWLLLLPIVCAWWLSLSLWLEPLALYREYQGRSDQFASALVYHLALVGAAVGASLLLGIVLALGMRRYPGMRKAGFGVLNVVQTIPSLALFGLLLAPLAWLASRVDWLASMGVSGIGWAPAWLALVGYSLLPMVRNTYVALEGVEPAVIESARGMGMSRRQTFLQVRLPLALPVVLEGVRITTVQAIGLTAVAALIGAGGLGTFIFQGLGQAAMDLVLLGALPIIALALIADALLGTLAERLRHGGTP
ncbi:ABC transporter permease [Halomonas alkalisoli]|uniref:ABC transporter permease n=1 Tax=Halomonas alkalisoli TaxID=2907158 RepID=UPI001F478056|nr:ABC transporter permease [Halomonas alkalisoli]MCE9684115.1 ABC transporter permease [Halomonas alkalisoli]